MKISYNWLKQFIEIDLPIEDISNLLTDIGLEVEQVETYESIKGGLKGVLVGEIVECEKHPNADRLKLTKVDVGSGNLLSIVCGAPNVMQGQTVLVATIGTTLNMYDGSVLKIKKGKIRGEISEGMICAEDELGLSDNHKGILVLDKKSTPGTHASTIFDLEQDFVFDIGLTPNRADAMSHMGVARDLKAVCIVKNIPYKWSMPDISSFKIDNTNKTITVRVNDADRCSQYYGLTLTNVKVKPSPGWLKNRLNAIGISPKNNVVDVTNYVLHELGQPLHAFDADKLDNEIIVKTCKENTSFTTLDGTNRNLNKDDLMICDNIKPHCIAGIFGGKDSGVENETKNIFLESAFFDPVSIRKTAKRHGLNTDASFRFERGIDPEIGITALKRAAILISELAGAKISSEIQKVNQKLNDESKIFLSFKKLNKIIGQNISKKTIKLILDSLEIKIENESKSGMNISVPRYRVDVKRTYDVIEEILRIYGFNNIEEKPLKYQSDEYYKWDDSHKLERIISEKLTGIGFSEIINNSISSLEETSDFYDPVKIINPLGKEFSYMRQSLIYNSLEVVAYNLNRQNNRLKLFELGNVYGKNNNKYVEESRLSISIVGEPFESNWNIQQSPDSFFYGKGVIIDLFETFGFNNIKFNNIDHPDFEFACEISSQNKAFGHYGLISKKVKERYSIEKEIYLAEINWSRFIENCFEKPTYFKDLPKFPSIKRDFALLLNKEITFEEIEEVSLKTERKILKSVELFDVYSGDKLPSGKKSYGVSFNFQDENRTLTDKHVDKIMKKLEKNFVENFNAELR